MFQDPQFARQYGAQVNDDGVQQMLSGDMDCWDCYQMGPLAWFDKINYAFVGRAGIKPMRVNNRSEIEFTYALRPVYWNQELATEIGRIILEKAFKD